MTLQGPLPHGCTPLGQSGTCALWRVDLDAGADLGPEVLSDSEQRRAQRFAFARDRRRYLKCRTVLRQLLADTLGAGPGQLQLQDGPQGKPYVPDAPNCQFNLSHSGSVGLIGIGAGQPMGLDVETRQYAPDFESMADTILTPRERQQLGTMPQSQRCEALLFAWTRKEACVKAIGVGLNIPPHTFETGFSGDCQIRIADQGTTYVLWLQTIEAGTDVVASLAHLT